MCIVPLDQRTSIADHRRAIAAVAPMFADAKIEFHAKYLGAVIGSTAHLVHWAAPGAKFLDRVRWLRAQDGACASLVANNYRMFAFSTLTFHCQFYENNRFISATERRAIHIALASPFNAWPIDIIGSMHKLGFHSCLLLLQIEGKATLLRHAMKCNVID